MSSIKTVSKIQYVINENSTILEEYIADIKASSKRLKNNSLMKKLEDNFDSVDKNLILDSDMEPFRPVIVNVMKAMMICHNRIKSSDADTDMLLDKIEIKDRIIDNLKEHIVKQNKVLQENDIKPPEYKEIKSFSLQTTAKSNSAISRRHKIQEQSDRDEESEINKWLNSIKLDRSKDNIRTIPNKILEKEGGRQGMKIKPRKEEVNKIIIPKEL